MGAHIHILGEAPGQAVDGGAEDDEEGSAAGSSGQEVGELNVQSIDRILPADSTASAFYITNVNNDVVGNVASGESFFIVNQKFLFIMFEGIC